VFRAETALHQASNALRLQRSFTLIPSANLIQSANRWRGTAKHHRYIGAQRALDQMRKSFAFVLLPPEPVDDHEVGALIDRMGVPGGEADRPGIRTV